MSSSVSANAVLDRVYLEIRCKLLDIAACLDRIARAEKTGAEKTGAEETGVDDESATGVPDARLAQIAKAIEILSSTGLGRAERIQMLFSDPYVPHWNRREGRATNGSVPHN